MKKHSSILLLLALLLLPSMAGAAITKVQGSVYNYTAGASATASFTNTPTEGNLLIAFGKASQNISGAAISGFTLAVSVQSGSSTYEGLWYKVAGAGESKDVVLTWTSSVGTTLIVEEWSGIVTSSPLDKTAYHTYTASNVTTWSSGTTATTTVATELVIAGFGWTGNTSSQTFTNSFQNEYVATNTLNLVSLVTSSTGAQETTASWTTQQYCGGLIATFKGIEAIAVPTFDVGSGTYYNNQSVTVTPASGAIACCTTDNSAPGAATAGTCDSSPTFTYSTPVSITATGTVLRCISTKSGSTNSGEAIATYTLTVGAVSANLATGTYLPNQSVTLSISTTTGGNIRYTTDGSTPACPSTGTAYSSPITVASTETIKAIGCKTDYNADSVATYVYTIRNAATYYVKNAGSDGAVGTSDGTAWQTIAHVMTVPLVPGDSILFNGGDIWREQLDLTYSGASGALITYGAYGTGRPKVYGSANNGALSWTNVTGNIWSCTQATDPDNIWFVANSTGAVTWGSKKSVGSPAYANLAAEYDWVQSSSTLYVYAATSPATRYAAVEVPARVYGISILSANSPQSYINVNGFEIAYNSGVGISLESNSIVTNNLVHHVGTNGANSVGVECQAGSGCTLSYNTVHNILNDGALIVGSFSPGTSSGNIIEHNTIYDCFDNLVKLQSNSPETSSSGNIIRYNNLYHSAGFTPTGTTKSAIHLLGYSGAVLTNDQIYYNVISTKNAGIWLDTYISGTMIYNNTILVTGTSSFGIYPYGTTGVSGLVIKNNLVADAAGAAFKITDKTVLATCDYNLWYTTATNYANVNGTNYAVGDNATYKTAMNAYGVGGVNHDLWQDPKVVSATDWHPMALSPAIDAGVSVALTSDYSGAKVPQRTTPSIGAYEYVRKKVGNRVMAGVVGAAAAWSCPDSVCETFNASTSCATTYSSNCDHTWVVTKNDAGDTIAFNNTAAPAPLEAGKTYGLRMTSTGTAGSIIQYSFTAADNAYLYLMVNFDALSDASGAYCFAGFQSSADADLCFLCFDSTPVWKLYNGSTFADALVGPAVDTTYHVWLDYVKNTSCTAYVSTTATKPSATLTATPPNTQAGKINLQTRRSSNTVFGKVRENTTAIGSNPQ